MSSPALPFAPGLARFLAACGGCGRRVAQALRAAGAGWAARREARRQHAELVALSPRTLADMGAPQWLEAEARAHRSAEASRRAWARFSS